MLVLVDTLRADHLGAYGYRRPTSPHLDALAARGLRYERAYAHASWTLPSVASLLTGLPVHDHRVGQSYLDKEAMGALPAARKTLAEALGAAGYRTAAFVNNPFLEPRYGLDQGFEVYDAADASNQHHRSASATVAAGLAWLDSMDGAEAGAEAAPAFLLLHFMEPHLDYAPAPATRGTWSAPRWPGGLDEAAAAGHVFKELKGAGATPEPALQRHLVDLYDEEILAADAALGELITGLEARGGLDRRLVVFTADHGEELWEHGGFEHGHSLLGEVSRVPLVLAGAGLEAGVVHTPVGQVDLFQGLLSAAGAARPPHTRGEPLLSLPSRGDRVILSENTLYGRPLASTVSRELRVQLVLGEDPEAPLEAWRVAADGSELEAVADPAGRPEVQALVEALRTARGDLREWPLAARAPSEGEVEAALEALGYTEGSPPPAP